MEDIYSQIYLYNNAKNEISVSKWLFAIWGTYLKRNVFFPKYTICLLMFDGKIIGWDFGQRMALVFTSQYAADTWYWNLLGITSQLGTFPLFYCAVTPRGSDGEPVSSWLAMLKFISVLE